VCLGILIACRATVKGISMSTLAESLKVQLERLPLQDRAELAYFLIDSLDEDIEAEVETSWSRELACRADDIRSGRAVGEPAASVFARLRSRSSRSRSFSIVALR